MTFEDLLKKWNNGILRGAKTKLAEKLGIGPGPVSDWHSGRIKPGEENVKKMAKLFGVSESTIQEAFGINPNTKFQTHTAPGGLPHRSGLLRDSDNYIETSPKTLSEYPLIAILKKGEVIFFNEKEIPYPERIGSLHKFSVEVRDNSALPDFEKNEVLEFLTVPEKEIEYDPSNKYLLVEIDGSQYLYRCISWGAKTCFSIDGKNTVLPKKNIKILARAVAAKRVFDIA